MPKTEEEKGPQFKKDSKEFKKLLQLLKDGKVKPSEKPLSVKKRYPKYFNQFSATQFRSQWGNAKNLLSANLKDDSSESEDESVVTQPPTAVVTTEDDGKSHAGSFLLNTPERPMSYDAWSPRKLTFEYENDEGSRCLAILFVLSSGAIANGDNSGVDVVVSTDGMEVSLFETWHPFTLDANRFYKKFPMAESETVPEYDRRQYAMVKAVRAMKACQLDSLLRSEYRMRLPFRVAPGEKRVTFTGSKDGCIVAAVDLCERKKDEKTNGCLMEASDDDSEPQPVELGKRKRTASHRYNNDQFVKK